MIVTKRILTLKSRIGFGKFSTYTVNDMLVSERFKPLLYMYFSLEKIDFNQEIKDQLCITKEIELVKPSRISYKNSEEKTAVISKCLKNIYAAIDSKKDSVQIIIEKRLSKKTVKEFIGDIVIKKIHRDIKLSGKGYLQAKNHNKL